MLEVVIPGQRIGHQHKAGEILVQGTVGFVSGVHTDGYYLIKAPSTGTEAAMAIYPFKKIYYAEDLSDTADAVNKIASGDPLIVFEGGEYITDKFITSGTGAIGSSTSQAYWMDGGLSSSWAHEAPTSTALYTEGAGKMVYLWPSTAAATKGYLRVATANDGSCTVSKFNKNFMLVKAYTRGYSGLNRVHFKVVGRDAFNGRFWTGISTAAFYNVGTVSV